jgi:hypothetical protein
VERWRDLPAGETPLPTEIGASSGGALDGE